VGTFPVPVDSNRSFLYCSIGEILGKTLYWRGVWSFEEGTLPLFFLMAESASTFIDIGAYVGIYTILAKTANPGIIAYAFEPVPSIHKRLVEHMKMNHLEEGVFLEQAAVSDASVDSIPLYVPQNPWAPSASLLSDYKTTTKNKISVRSYTLDEYVENREIENVDLVKIDVEGAESQVLEGAKNTISRHRPTIICEILPQNVEKLLNIEDVLRKSMYSVSMITPQGLKIQSTITPDTTRANRNFLLYPKEKSLDIERLAGEGGSELALKRRRKR
jgi:FkbM family methyltransferase